MLIFEGPDGAGKTTLIDQYKEVFDLEVAPRVVSKETNAMVDLQQWVDKNLDDGFQNLIFDRYRLISETIYGPVLRKGSQPGFNELSWLGPRLKRFYELKPIIIYCLPPLSEVIKNIEHDLGNTAVYGHIEQIYSAYVAKAAMDRAFSPATIHIWDYTTSPQIKGKPAWFFEVYREMQERLY